MSNWASISGRIAHPWWRKYYFHWVGQSWQLVHTHFGFLPIAHLDLFHTSRIKFDAHIPIGALEGPKTQDGKIRLTRTKFCVVYIANSNHTVPEEYVMVKYFHRLSEHETTWLRDTKVSRLFPGRIYTELWKYLTFSLHSSTSCSSVELAAWIFVTMMKAISYDSKAETSDIWYIAPSRSRWGLQTRRLLQRWSVDEWETASPRICLTTASLDFLWMSTLPSTARSCGCLESLDARCEQGIGRGG